MILSAAASIEIHKQQINELNVFPVPDGDTGTNMSLTIQTAVNELRKCQPATVDEAAKVTASGLLRGARGNSGVILSLLFRGLSKSAKGLEEMDGVQLAAAMSEGVTTAYGAVMKPAEGTILTVSRLAAERAVNAAEEHNSVEYVIEQAIAQGEITLAQTTDMNPVLKKAGVVDAGGMGFCLILRGMLESLRGNDIVCEDTGAVNEEADFGIFDSEDITFAFDTVFIVRKSGRSIEPFRRFLDGIGDSLVIGEDDEAFKVHVHTNIPGEALTKAQKYGTLELAKIENMRTQYEDIMAGRKAQSTDDLDAIERELEGEETVAAPVKHCGVVAICAGEGMAQLFRELGADTIVTGGQTMNPSTDDILKEINRTPSEVVFVLPNNKNIIMAAEQCIPICQDKQVIVIPTKTVPQGITAMLNFSPDDEVEEITETLGEAIKSVHTAQVTYAARDSDFDGHIIHAGEYLALLDGKLIGSYTDMKKLMDELGEAASELDPELVTVYYGENVDEKTANETAAILEGGLPDAEVTVVNGGQPVYYYMISIE